MLPRRSHLGAQMCGVEPREFRSMKRACLPNYFFIGVAVMNVLSGVTLVRDSDGIDGFAGDHGYSNSMNSEHFHCVPFELLNDEIYQNILLDSGWNTLRFHSKRQMIGSTSILGIVCSTWQPRNYLIR